MRVEGDRRGTPRWSKRPLHDQLQNFLVAEMKPVKVADRYNRPAFRAKLRGPFLGRVEYGKRHYRRTSKWSPSYASATLGNPALMRRALVSECGNSWAMGVNHARRGS